MKFGRRRRRRRLPLLFLSAALSLFLPYQHVRAQIVDPPDTSPQTAQAPEACITPDSGIPPSVNQVKALILVGRLDEASRALDCIVITPENETDVRFLRGHIAEARGDFTTAIDEYREILLKRPNLTRVRLELARLLFLTKDDAASRHNFELVLGADIPQAVRDNVMRFLAAIRQRQTVQTELSLGIVPDSNINTATRQSEIILFDLPFRLSDDATQQSGVGASVRGAVMLRQPLTDEYGLEAGVGVQRIEHSGDRFDDMRVNAFAGLRRNYTDLDIGARAIFSHQWFGGMPISHSVGAELDVGGWIRPRLETRLFIGGEVRNYDESDFLDGFLVSISGLARYSLSPVSLADALIGVAREQTDDPGFSNTQPFIGARYFQALPMGISVSAGPLIGFRNFDEPIAAFGKTRRDVVLQFKTEIVLRKNVAFGFAPMFSYTYTYNRSNIDLFEYKRHLFELGLTKLF